MKCVAIDDEPLALAIINNFCERHEDMDLKTFSNPEEGMKEILQSRPDIVFLDVEMNDISGLLLAQELPEESSLIFTTAHAQYALDGFNLDATDFLHKPFSYERFKQAINKAKLKISKNEDDFNGHITIMSEYRSISFRLCDILYVEALGNYTKIFTTDGKYTLAHANMRSLSKLLPEKYFCRIQRSYIVSLPKVRSYNKSSLDLINFERTLPIGKQYAENFMAKILHI